MSFSLPPPRPGSLRFSIESKYGSNITIPAIFKSEGVVETEKWLKDLLRSYLNDYDKPNHKKPLEHETTLEYYCDLVVSGDARQRPGIDYVVGDAGLNICGYLRELLSKNVVDIDALSETEKNQALRRLWTKKRLKYKKKGHHLIFSVDPRISSALGEIGISIDVILHSAISDALGTYNNRFYRDCGSLGWVTGIHHDKHHVHAHVLVFPTTSEGKGLNLCNRARVNVEGNAIRVNFLDVIVQAYFSAMERLCRLALTPLTIQKSDSLAKIIEFGGMLDACSLEMRIAACEIAPSLADALKELPEFIKKPDALGKVNVAIQRRHPKPNTTNATYYIDRVKRYQSSIQRCKNELEGDVLRVASTKARVARLFKEWRKSPDGYRGIKYTPNTPLQSPSSTLSFLSIAVNKNYWDKPSLYPPTRSETRAILTGKIARNEAVLARQAHELPSEATFKPEHTNDVYDRVGLVVAMMVEVYSLYMGMKTGKSIYSNTPELKCLMWKSPEAARDGMLAAAKKGARAIAHEQRTATAEELLQAHDLKEVSRIRSADEAEAEPEKMILPAKPFILPTGTNFLEREAGRAGLRSISQMREQNEALFKKICRDLSWNPADSSPYWA